MTKKSKRHSFVVTVTMNKPCNARRALAEIRGNIYGTHYCTPFCDEDPDTFRIRSIKPEKRGQQ
jgi:hypothetical protein